MPYRPIHGVALLGLALYHPAPVLAGDWFSDEAAASGLVFHHFNGATGGYYSAEIMAPGVALFDYDRDGDLDVYVPQGAVLGPGKKLADAVYPPVPGQPLSHRLFRNDLVVHRDGRRALRFTDVTERAGLRLSDYGFGATSGDYDNDGWVDLYVTGLTHNHLLHNNGDGTFSDVTAAAGVDDPRWSAGAAFVDYDRDGLLDLYVANYVDPKLATQKPCHSQVTARDYCTPLVFTPLSDRLFHNLGQGRFADVSLPSGIAEEAANGLGVSVADFNGDGWPDIYVANDAMPNALWINQKNGRFQNDAFMAGAAVNMEGAPEASMGVDAADVDEDGDEDLFVTHLKSETNTLYLNDGHGWFEDRSLATGLGPASRPYTSFGTAWLDYDNDGRLDLFAANGEITLIRSLVAAKDPFPLHQPNQLFHNDGKLRFSDVSARAGRVFRLSEVSRGTAVGDIDNDGDPDLVVANNNGPLRLLVNHLGERRQWLGLRVLDRHGRDALGARVEVRRTGATSWRRVRVDGSYASANDPRVLLGLGEAKKVDGVRVHWPDGTREQWPGLATGRYHTLRQGQGQEARSP